MLPAETVRVNPASTRAQIKAQKDVVEQDRDGERALGTAVTGRRNQRTTLMFGAAHDGVSTNR